MQGVVSDKTVAHYRWLLENVQDAALNAITEETVQALVARRKAEGLSENSVYMLPRLIRRVLDHAAAEGLCEAPGWQIKPETPEKEHKETLLTPSEERQLLQYLTAHPDPRNLVLDLILSTGISGSEALQLTWADVSFRQSRIRVAGRQVPIDERQRIQLQKQRSLPNA